MGIICSQPFKNKYTISQLESWGIDISQFTEKDKNEYLFKGKGKIAKIAKNIDKILLKDKYLQKLTNEIVYSLYPVLDKFKADNKIKSSMISCKDFEQGNTRN